MNLFSSEIFYCISFWAKNMTGVHLFRYSGAGDELISPVYIAPTLPPYVERTWPDDEVTVWMMKIMNMMMMMHDDHFYDDDEDV